MWFALAVGLSMAGKDCAYSAATFLISRGHAWLASQCDTAGDFCSLVCVGMSGSEILKYGWSWNTVAVLGALWLGSIVGTVAGVKLGQRMAKHV